MPNFLSIYKREKYLSIFDKRFYITFSVLLCIVVVTGLIFVPERAYAVDFFTDPFGWINENICGFVNKLLISVVNAEFQLIMKLLTALTPADLLTADWETLFGNTGIKANGLFDMMRNICNGIVKPIASTILGAVFMMQFIKITTKAESNGTAPLLKEIFIAFLIFMIFNWLVSHADDICAAIYQIANRIAIFVRDYASVEEIKTSDINFIVDDGWDAAHYALASVGSIITCIFVLLIGVLGALVCFIFATFATYARALQLYIYAAFSPIPMSMLGFEETRSWGVGYFRNFASVALASAILLFIMYAFPLILVSCIQFSNLQSYTEPQQIASFMADMTQVGPILTILKLLALMLVFIIAVKNSGKYAKAILGA